MARETGYIQVVTTVGKKGDAERIAKALARARLSACTQIVGPITSVYRWEGKFKQSKEWLCAIKTKKAYYTKVERAIKRHHPYKLPEIIALPIVAGSKGYLSWVGKGLKKK